MTREKCPKCKQLKFDLKQTKSKYIGKCKNCDFIIQMPSVKIYIDEKLPSIIDKYRVK